MELESQATPTTEHVSVALTCVKMQRGCELCEGMAALYCPADKAHLCWTCDGKVHSANFLVARHTRFVLCTTCATPTPWRTSGANPTPQTGLCANCSQGESQGECATHNDDETPNHNLIPRVANSSACSSSNAAEQLDSTEDGNYNPTENLSSPTVSTVPASFSSRVSPSKLTMSSNPCSQRDVENVLTTSKQVATMAFQDVNQTGARAQCDCASIRRRDSQPQAQPPCRECWRSYLVGSHRVSFPSKRQRVSMSTRKRMRMLSKWHWELQLSSPATVPLALRMFRKVSPAVGLSNVRVMLAACLRVSAGIDEAQVAVPEVCEVATCVGVSARKLALMEMHLMALLGWRRVALCAGEVSV